MNFNSFFLLIFSCVLFSCVNVGKPPFTVHLLPKYNFKKVFSNATGALKKMGKKSRLSSDSIEDCLTLVNAILDLI